jgi:hypothetical protein
MLSRDKTCFSKKYENIRWIMDFLHGKKYCEHSNQMNAAL